jgi:hypothetical protein
MLELTMHIGKDFNVQTMFNRISKRAEIVMGLSFSNLEIEDRGELAALRTKGPPDAVNYDWEITTL